MHHDCSTQIAGCIVRMQFDTMRQQGVQCSCWHAPMCDFLRDQAISMWKARRAQCFYLVTCAIRELAFKLAKTGHVIHAT